MRQWPHLPTAQDILRSKLIHTFSASTPLAMRARPVNFIMGGGPTTSTA